MTLHHTLRTTALIGLLSCISLTSMAMPGADSHHTRSYNNTCDMATPHHGMGAVQHWHRVLHRLNLSDVQHDQVFELMHGQAKERHTLLRQLRQVQTNLYATAQAPQFDNAKAQILAHEQAQLMAQQLLLDVQLEGKLRSLLTPEQKQQLDQSTTHRLGVGMVDPNGNARPHAPMLHQVPREQLRP